MSHVHLYVIYILCVFSFGCDDSHNTKEPIDEEKKYSLCTGQENANVSSVPLTGSVEMQLAPAFLDKMEACRAEDALPNSARLTTDGEIDVKGDCVFVNGVSCHYHSGSEFVSMAVQSQTPSRGELHCIIPSGQAQSPRVYGGHIECNDAAQGVVHDGHVSHEIHQGKKCSAQILEAIVQCSSLRCCDEGTLTNPIATLINEGRNNIRPDFRICQDTLKIDCNLIANYTAHPANCPSLGGVADPVFAVSLSPSPE